MKSTIVIFTALLFSHAVTLKGQSFLYTAEVANKIKSTVLLVSIEGEDPAKIKKYTKKPELMAIYQEQISTTAEYIKFAVTNYWKFSSYEFKPLEEAEMLARTQPDKYSLLRTYRYVEIEVVRTSMAQQQAQAARGAYVNKWKGTQAVNEILEIYLIQNNKTFLYASLPSLMPTKGNMIQGVMQLQTAVQYAIDKNMSKTSDNAALTRDEAIVNKKLAAGRTLLIDRSDVDDKLTEEKIAQIYPYKFKLVEEEDIENALISQDSTVAFLSIVNLHLGQGNMNMIEMLTPQGKMLSYSVPKGLVVGSFNKRVREKGITDIAEKVK